MFACFLVATKTVKRCSPQTFTQMDIMCSEPGTVIDVTRVFLSHYYPACNLDNEDCIYILQPDDNYYKRVSSACNGRQSCDNVTAESRKIRCSNGGNYYSDYVAIQYVCLSFASMIYVHYLRHNMYTLNRITSTPRPQVKVI